MAQMKAYTTGLFCAGFWWEEVSETSVPLSFARAKAQAECLIQGKMGIVSCPTLSSDYFCLKYFGFVYDQSLQWKSSLDSVRHWSSNFFYYKTDCLQCFLFGKQNNGTKTKVGLSTFHQIQHQTFFEFGG